MDSKKITRKQIISSFVWRICETVGRKGITFIVSIILARLLLPEDFGLIVLVMTFMSISGAFIEYGFTSALVRKKEADDLDFSSVFYLSIVFAILLYILFWFAAPSIASFFSIEQITSVFRILSITLFFGVINSLQEAYMAKEMKFKQMFQSTLAANIISAIIGISMAFSGFGVWALVGQDMSAKICSCVIKWFIVKWRPKLLFSFNRLKSLFSFGWKIFFVYVIDALYKDLNSIIIGKNFSPAMLGYYIKGITFSKFIIENINRSIQDVMFPALSIYQDNIGRVKAMMRRSIVTSSFFVFPAMTGLAVTAESLVILLLTEKWLPCVFFLQVSCFIYAFWPINTANLQVQKAMGEGSIFLKIGIIKKIIGLGGLAIAILCFGTVKAIIIAEAIVSPIAMIISVYPNKKIVGYKIKEQLIDVLPSFILALTMGLIILTLEFLNYNIVITLLLQIFIGGAFYFGVAWFLKMECFCYLINLLKSIRPKKMEKIK